MIKVIFARFTWFIQMVKNGAIIGNLAGVFYKLPLQKNKGWRLRAIPAVLFSLGNRKIITDKNRPIKWFVPGSHVKRTARS
jgi:hypothetical protein